MPDELHRFPNGIRYAVTWTQSYQLPVFFLEYYQYASNNALLNYKRGSKTTMLRYAPALFQVVQAFRSRFGRKDNLSLVPVLRSNQRRMEIGTREHVVVEALGDSLGIEVGSEVFSQEPRPQAHKVAVGYLERHSLVFESLRCNDPPKNILLVDDLINTGATIEAYNKCARIKGGAVIGAVTLMKNQIKPLLNPNLLQGNS